MASKMLRFSSSCSLLGFLCSSKFNMHFILTPYIILVVNSDDEKQLKSVIISRSSWNVDIFSSDSSAKSSISSSFSSSSSSSGTYSSAALFLASRASYCSILMRIKVVLKTFSVSYPWRRVTGGSSWSLVLVLISRRVFSTSLLFTQLRIVSLKYMLTEPSQNNLKESLMASWRAYTVLGPNAMMLWD